MPSDDQEAARPTHRSGHELLRAGSRGDHLYLSEADRPRPLAWGERVPSRSWTLPNEGRGDSLACILSSFKDLQEEARRASKGRCMNTPAQQRKQYAARLAKGLCVGCGSRKRAPQQGRRLCRACLRRKLENYYTNKEHKLSAQKKYVRTLRVEALDAYGGPVCSCCGEDHEEFLTIDHVNGGGSAHRRSLKSRGGHSFYLWLRRNNYPKGFRILCMNCNFAYGMRGYCPHKKRSRK